MDNLPEAPYSFNMKAFDPYGFDVMFTVRDATGAEFMKRITGLTLWLRENGYTPQRVGGTTTQANGGNGNGAGPLCPVHDRAMRRSNFKDEGMCTAKLDGGGYCNETA